jgi:hypothetical protein
MFGVEMKESTLTAGCTDWLSKAEPVGCKEARDFLAKNRKEGKEASTAKLSAFVQHGPATSLVGWNNNLSVHPLPLIVSKCGPYAI